MASSSGQSYFDNLPVQHAGIWTESDGDGPNVTIPTDKPARKPAKGWSFNAWKVYTKFIDISTVDSPIRMPPRNVRLSDWAVAAILLAGVEAQERYRRWPADFLASGGINANRMSMDPPAKVKFEGQFYYRQWKGKNNLIGEEGVNAGFLTSEPNVHASQFESWLTRSPYVCSVQSDIDTTNYDRRAHPNGLPLRRIPSLRPKPDGLLASNTNQTREGISSAISPSQRLAERLFPPEESSPATKSKSRPSSSLPTDSTASMGAESSESDLYHATPPAESSSAASDSKKRTTSSDANALQDDRPAKRPSILDRQFGTPAITTSSDNAVQRQSILDRQFGASTANPFNDSHLVDSTSRTNDQTTKHNASSTSSAQDIMSLQAKVATQDRQLQSMAAIVTTMAAVSLTRRQRSIATATALVDELEKLKTEHDDLGTQLQHLMAGHDIQGTQIQHLGERLLKHGQDSFRTIDEEIIEGPAGMLEAVGLFNIARRFPEIARRRQAELAARADEARGSL